MSVARARVDVPGAKISQAEALWYDRARWPAFVDGLHAVKTVEGAYPQPGARVVWDSFQGGRGRVLERVVSYEPRVGQELDVEDERIRGVQRLRFTALDGGGVRVALELDYSLKERGPLTGVSDLFFIRRAQADSLRRTLLRFARELRDEREPPL